MNAQYATQSATLGVHADDVRLEDLRGREHVVAPVTLVREMVLKGEFLPFEEIEATQLAWNAKPSTITHPTNESSDFVPASHPYQYESHVAATLFGVETSATTNALEGEVWIDRERSAEVADALDRDDPAKMLLDEETVEVSVGYWYQRFEADGEHDGDSLAVWPSIADNGIEFTQDTSSGRPTYNASNGRLNDNPTIDFDGNDDVMVSDMFDIRQTRTVVLVVADTDASRDIVTSGSGPPTAPGQFRIEDNAGKDRLYNDTGLNTSSSGLNDESIYVLHIDGESGNGFVRRNGVETANGDVGTGGVEQLGLGDGIDFTGQHADVDIGEYLFYDRALTATETNEIEGHLSNKWAISLS